MNLNQVTKLDCIADSWANEVMTEEKQWEMATDVMDLLPDVLDHIKLVTAEAKDQREIAAKYEDRFFQAKVLLEQVTAERDAALKACAQKDDALQDCSQFPLGESLHYKVCSALDDNTCGQHYHHDDEWKVVVDALERTLKCSHVIGGCDTCKDILNEALAHAEKLTSQ